MRALGFAVCLCALAGCQAVLTDFAVGDAGSGGSSGGGSGSSSGGVSSSSSGSSGSSGGSGSGSGSGGSSGGSSSGSGSGGSSGGSSGSSSGGACSIGPCPVASGLTNAPAVLAVDATNVYWRADGDGPVAKCAISGCGSSPTILAPAAGTSDTYGIGVDATSVYWANEGTAPNYTDGAVMSVPIGGGTPTTIASGQALPGGIALDQTNVYWTNQNGGTVMSALKSGSTPTLVAGSQSSPSGIAIYVSSTYGTVVYFTDAGSAVMKEQIGSLLTLASSSQVMWGATIAVDGTNVYWANQGTPPNYTDGSIVMTPVGGGGSTTLASGQPVPSGIAIDSTSVYWITGANTLVSAPIGGGSATTLVSGQSLRALAVDSTNVYWATANAVMRLAK